MGSRRNAGRARAKFFCDNCGAEVPLEAPSCSQCGRPFSSVRCPRCGFSGPPRSFLSGCPACGYAAVKENMGQTRRAGPPRPRLVLPRSFYTAVVIVLAVLLLASILVLAFRLSRQ